MKKLITGKSTKTAASMFSIGNMVAALIPVPFMVLWFGAGILVYALNSGHPDKRVGKFTVRAAHRYYAVTGTLIVVGKFIPESSSKYWYYLGLWILGILILIPASLWDLHQIRHQEWKDECLEVDG